jgi:AraC-like DNA-binding protein
VDITQTLLFIGAFQGLLLGMVLLRKKQNRKDNRFLAILFVLIAFQTYLLSTDKLYEFLGCGLINVFSRLVFLLYGPLIYFYVRSLIDSSFSFNHRYSWHFLPFVFFSICSFISYQIWDQESSLDWMHYIANTHYFFPDFYASLRLLYLLIYIVLSIQILNRYRVKSQQLFSNATHIQTNWLYQFLVASFLLWGIVALGLKINYYDGNPNSNAFQSIFFVLPIFIYWVSYKALTHSVFFNKVALNNINQKGNDLKKAPKDKSGKYYRSGLKPLVSSKIKQQLVLLMEKEKPHLNPNLKLRDLAQLLNIAPHHLSQVLNEQLGCNFYEFVNKYRIEAAKYHLQDLNFQHFTIEAIAFESGFNSKSTFNSLFKRQVGQTPGQWRKNGLYLASGTPSNA